MNVLIAGCGYVGSTLAQELVAKGHSVWGLRRSAAPLPPGVRLWRADLGVPASLAQPPAAFDALVYTAGASGFTEADYRAAYVDGPRHLIAALAGHPLRRSLFTSSTGVYGDSGGAWLDEDSPAESSRFSGAMLREGEDVFRGSGVPAVVVRLGGIYGPGRTRLIDQVRSGSAACVEGQRAWLNLIHRDDAAGMLAHLLDLDDPESLYLGVDNEPVERCALLRWLAEQIGAPAPRTLPGGEGSEPQRGGDRRFRNARIRATGYRLRFPDYRRGYGQLLKS